MEKKYTYEEFLQIIKRLRAEDGCPWDRAQTHESLKPCMLEEAYEVVEAIDQKDEENLKEELGDVLLQVVMHAQIAEEENWFDMADIVDGIASKMVSRHPHIFGDASVTTSEEVLDQWEAIKKKEKHETTIYESLKRVPKALPANIRAAKVQKKAAVTGYEFADIHQVWDKVREELEELENAVLEGNQAHIDDEFGDVMFSLINYFRFLGVNAENSLTNAIEKFINRLGSVENLAKSKGLELSALDPEQLDQLWELNKKLSRQ